ncbi:MAG: glycoside hydrolase family 1 protein [Candidatus Saccharimonadales bacterium]
MYKKMLPEGFLWGSSVSSYQVEGDNYNQWSEWEQVNAERLAKTSEWRLKEIPNWQAIKNEAKKKENYISGNGVEHFTRFEKDFALLKQLNMNAFRFSVEWSRIEPKEGQWDVRAIDHYHHYIAELKRLGIEPFLTIWHWTVPVWFAEKGGFEKRRNLSYFEHFVAKVAKEFGQELDYVIILNEPNLYAISSYVQGNWPPQQRNPLLAIYVFYNLACAHRRAYLLLKSDYPSLAIGTAAQLGNVRPKGTKNIINRLTVKIISYCFNWWFLNRIKGYLDFIGLNYYFTTYHNWYGLTRNPPRPLSDLGWYMEPSGIQPLLETLWHRFRKPIIITENGLADNNDIHRQWWLEQTMIAMKGAIRNGVQLFGYLHWSLLDNFEWQYGWWPKFGLIAVDRRTMKRTIRPSARWFAKQIKQIQQIT